MNAIRGSVTAILSSLFIWILFAYTFRIPIPLIGMQGPFGEFSSYRGNVIEVVTNVFLAWLVFGTLFGGFMILAILGAVTGIKMGHKYQNTTQKDKMIMLWASAVAVIPVFLLSISDYIFGPW